MHSPSFVRPIALALLILATTFTISGQESSPATGVQAAYPDSPDGLKLLIRDVFTAMNSKDDQKTLSYFSSMTLSDHTAWFTKVFGPIEGARMDTKYADLLPGLPEKLIGVFEYALKDDRTDPQVNIVEKGSPASSLGNAVIDAMQTPIPLYVASGSNAKRQFGALIGDFFYVDGAFRYIPTQVLLALSTAPPTRIRLGGNVQAALVVKRIAPTYPDEAKAGHVQGTVILHAVIGTDGTIKELTAVSGDPVLIKAALEAVQQWKYRPYLLNGMPVEVDTTINVDFRMQ